MSEDVEITSPESPDEGPETRPELPPADFDFLIYSLRLQAELNLGTLPFGAAGEEMPEPDLELARHNIDLLGVLQEKTRGNLTADELEALDTSVAELRIRFLQIRDQSQNK